MPNISNNNNSTKSNIAECSGDDDSKSFAEYEDDSASFCDYETIDLQYITSESSSYSTTTVSYSTTTVSVSSLMDNSSTSDLMPKHCPSCTRPSKNVRFGYAQVRQYNVTVGSHTAAADSCPLQLSWEHTEDAYIGLRDHSSSSSLADDDIAPRKLCLKERRERIALVQSISLARVRELEYEILMQQIEAVMEETKIASQKLQAIHATDNDSACSDMSPRTAMIECPRAA
jgi:hypothetical protein